MLFRSDECYLFCIRAYHIFQSEDEPDDGISSRSGGRLNLASTAAPDPPESSDERPNEPDSADRPDPEPGPSGAGGTRSEGRESEPGPSGGGQGPSAHLVTDSVVMATVQDRYEVSGGCVLCIV